VITALETTCIVELSSFRSVGVLVLVPVIIELHNVAFKDNNILFRMSESSERNAYSILQYYRCNYAVLADVRVYCLHCARVKD
jgi:hypothetical protein